MEKDIFVELMSISQSKFMKNVDLIKKLDSNLDKSIIKKIYFGLEEVYPNISNKKEIYEMIYEKCLNDNIKIISYIDSEYPDKLKNIKYPPLVLFCKGNINLLKYPSIAIVGSRAASVDAMNWTIKISEKLASSGQVIVSGGATGIDYSAHSGALRYCKDKTICVLGCGLNKIYPKNNQNLIENIKQKGLVITEYPPDKIVNQNTLAYRNRIISGISKGIVIVASKENGGSVIQSDYAISQNKIIMCPNPSLGLKPQNGIIKLINNNIAYSVNDVEDIKNKLKNFPPLIKNENILSNNQSKLDCFC